MSKNAKSKNSDPLASVRAVLVDAVDTAVANNSKVLEMAGTESAKAKALAEEQAGKLQAAVQANVDAANASGEIVAAGAEKAGVLVQGEMSKLVEGRIAAFKTMLGASSIKDAIEVQTALIKNEQALAQSFVESFVNLGQNVANDALKPVQAQATENMKAINLKVA